jgi:hypothetical protein
MNNTNNAATPNKCDICPRPSHCTDHSSDGEAFHACMDHVQHLEVWILDYECEGRSLDGDLSRLD